MFYLSYEQGWDDAFKAIADYVEKEVCPITGQMIRRMKDEAWRFKSVDGEQAECQDGNEIEEQEHN